MNEHFSAMLAVGGKSNSLGRVNEVIDLVLADQSRFDELYVCLFEDDAWVRMRAADAVEKICRQQPSWLQPYLSRLPVDLHSSNQPSIQWHLAQIYREVSLTSEQKKAAIAWLKQLLSTKDVDWIVSANAMDTLSQFVGDGSVAESDFIDLLKIQQHHKSKTVVKRANKFLVSKELALKHTAS